MSHPPGWRRWRTPVGVGIAVVAIAVAAAFANIALLGSAGEDRLGRLRPVTDQAAARAPAATDEDGPGGDAVIPGAVGVGTSGTETGGATAPDDHGGRGRDHDEDD